MPKAARNAASDHANRSSEPRLDLRRWMLGAGLDFVAGKVRRGATTRMGQREFGVSSSAVRLLSCDGLVARQRSRTLPACLPGSHRLLAQWRWLTEQTSPGCLCSIARLLMF